MKNDSGSKLYSTRSQSALFSRFLTALNIKFRILIVFGFLVWMVCAMIQMQAFALELQRREAALLITRADISDLDKGYVLGYFPNVVLTHHKLDPKSGYFVFDSEKDSSVEQSNYIKFDIQSSGKYKMEAKELISALRGQLASLPSVAAGLKTLPENLFLTSFKDKQVLSSIEVNSFSQGKVAGWFLLKGQMEKKEDKEETVRLEPVTSSIQIQLGEREEMEKIHGQEQQEENKGGASIYTRHFNKLPLRLTIIKEAIGRKDSVAGEVEGISLVRHIQQPSGNIVMAGDAKFPLTPAPMISISESKGSMAEVQFEINAPAFIKNIVEPALEPEDPAKRGSNQAQGLECVIPDDKNSQKDTACKNIGGQIIIEGTLSKDRSNPKDPVVFWLQPKKKPTIWFRCELTVNPNVADTPTQEADGPAVSSPIQTDAKPIERSKKKSGLE